MLGTSDAAVWLLASKAEAGRLSLLSELLLSSLLLSSSLLLLLLLLLLPLLLPLLLSLGVA